MARWAVALVALASSGGCAPDVVTCEDDQNCTVAGVEGRCVPAPAGIRYCANQDGRCGSGLRWDSTAGDGLSEMCVGPSSADAAAASDRVQMVGDDMSSAADSAVVD